MWQVPSDSLSRKWKMDPGMSMFLYEQGGFQWFPLPCLLVGVCMQVRRGNTLCILGRFGAIRLTIPCLWVLRSELLIS